MPLLLADEKIEGSHREMMVMLVSVGFYWPVLYCSILWPPEASLQLLLKLYAKGIDTDGKTVLTNTLCHRVTLIWMLFDDDLSRNWRNKTQLMPVNMSTMFVRAD